MSSYDHALDWVRRETDSGALPAAVLGIATADGVQELVAFGASGERAASVGDHFPLFSVTKPIVAMTDPLSAAIPEFGAQRADTVLLHHMLSHSSGIGDPLFDSATGRRADLLADGSEFAAGTAVRYSTLALEGESG